MKFRACSQLIYATTANELWRYHQRSGGLEAFAASSRSLHWAGSDLATMTAASMFSNHLRQSSHKTFFPFLVCRRGPRRHELGHGSPCNASWPGGLSAKPLIRSLKDIHGSEKARYEVQVLFRIQAWRCGQGLHHHGTICWRPVLHLPIDVL